MKSFAHKFVTNSSGIVYTINFENSSEAQKFLVECFWELYEILNKHVPDNISISFSTNTSLDIADVEEGVKLNSKKLENEINKLLKEKGFNGWLSVFYEG